MPKFYPTTPKQKQIDYKAQLRRIENAETELKEKMIMDIKKPLSEISDDAPYKKIHDLLVNNIANLGVNNSLLQYSEFVNNRISYAEMAFLRGEAYFSNAIEAYRDDLIDKRGKFKLLNFKDEFSEKTENDILQELETELQKFNFWDKLKNAIDTSLTFGGALVFIDCNTDNYTKPIYKNFEKMNSNGEAVQDFKVIEPYLCSPYEVNTINPLNSDYMKPSQWYISGAGAVSGTRIEPLIFKEAPNLVKPIYNFLGFSKIQQMREAVKIAESLNNSNAEIAMRFRTTGIESGLVEINQDYAVSRSLAINKLRNNLGLLLLTDKEKYFQTDTNLSGLSEIQNLALQNVAACAYIPRNKLLGDEPSGFSSGEFSTKNYYDTIESIQATILKPFLVKLAQMILWKLNYNYILDFEFNPVAQENAKEKAERENLATDKITKLYTNSIIDGEQAFKIGQNDGIIDKNEVYAFEADEPSDSETENLLSKVIPNGEATEATTEQA